MSPSNRDWTPKIDADASRPLYLRLARGIAAELAAGNFPPGAKLPGSRSLAERLGASRNTVNAAFAMLESEGWLELRGSSGTYVNPALAEHLSGERSRRFLPTIEARASVPARTGYALRSRPGLTGGEQRERSPAVALAMDGQLDLRLQPTALLARTYRSVLTREPALLDHASGDEPGRGQPRLLEALVAYLGERRSLASQTNQLLVTRGAQMAIWLAAAALLMPGDRVVVERFGYRPAWLALRAHGAKLVPVSTDEQGLLIDKLEQALAKGPIRAVYLTPHHQFPTTASLSPARRGRLLELAREHRFAIIEDDYDHEFHHEGQPLAPLASGDRDGNVIYVGSMSALLSPGMRLGWMLAPEPLIERCADLRELIDRQGDPLSERVVAELLDAGELQRHFWRTRRTLASRRDALLSALTSELGSTLELPSSSGGLALWAGVDPQIDVDAWAERALAAGVEVHPARLFHFRRRAAPNLRLGFARLDEDELREAVKRLAKAL